MWDIFKCNYYPLMHFISALAITICTQYINKKDQKRWYNFYEDSFKPDLDVMSHI